MVEVLAGDDAVTTAEIVQAAISDHRLVAGVWLVPDGAGTEGTDAISAQLAKCVREARARNPRVRCHSSVVEC